MEPGFIPRQQELVTQFAVLSMNVCFSNCAGSHHLFAAVTAIARRSSRCRSAPSQSKRTARNSRAGGKAPSARPQTSTHRSRSPPGYARLPSSAASFPLSVVELCNTDARTARAGDVKRTTRAGSLRAIFALPLPTPSGKGLHGGG
jgi:hypothetical protein